MISGERKKFGLVARRTVGTLHESVANTGQLHYDGKVKTFRFTFSEDFVKFVGTMLPSGVSKFNPAYIFVVLDDGAWVVWAAYVEENRNPVALWRTPTQPPWTPEIKDHEQSSSNRHPQTRSSSGSTKPLASFSLA